MNRFLNPYLYRKDFGDLVQNDMPPTLYKLMNSYVNYGKEDNEIISSIDLPKFFKDYLFDFCYPLDVNLKPKFEENFLTHYMFRRIGFETFTSFKIHLKAKLNEIMPKYNHLLLEFNNLDFVGSKEEHIRKVDGSSSSESSGSSSTTSDNRYSDTPENQLNDVKNGTYLTDYTYNIQEGESEAEASGETHSEENLTITRGDSTDEYIKIQNRIENIYTQIYKELDSLFYGII